MYAALARSVLSDADPDRVVQEVRKVRERHPDLSSDELARKLTQRTAIRCAAVAALASAPVGWLCASPLAADLSYQVSSLNRLALSIAHAHRRPAAGPEHALAAAGSLLVAGAAHWLRRGALNLARRSLSRRAPRLLPVVGALVGGALSYAAARTFGGAVQDYCQTARTRRRARH